VTANVLAAAVKKIGEYDLIIEKQGKLSLAPTFQKLWESANAIGANAFSIESVGFEDDKYYIEVDVYYLDEPLMQENFSFYEDNIIVIFGDLNTKDNTKEKSCKVNKEKISILPYSYIKLRNEIGNETKLSIGGFIGGESIHIVGEENKLGRCFTLGGASVAPLGGSVSFGNRGGGVGVGIAIKTGSIKPMELSFGLFLMTIFDTVKNNLPEIDEIK